MSDRDLPVDSEHESKMATARQLRAEQTRASSSKNHAWAGSRHIGKSHESSENTSMPYGTKPLVAYPKQAASTNKIRQKQGLASSMWASRVDPEFVLTQLRVPEPPAVIPKHTISSDLMSFNQPAILGHTASTINDQSATVSEALTGGLKVSTSISQTTAMEKSILDEDVPFVEELQGVLCPIQK